MIYNKLSLAEINQNGRQFPGSFQIEQVTLLGVSGSVNLTEDVAQITFYESLESPFLFGEISIVDIKNTLLYNRITGMETLEISIRDGAMQTFLRLKCYKLANRERMNPTSERFTLYFTSFEFFRSQNQKISKSYMNMKGDEIVLDMLKKTIPDFDDSRFYHDTTMNKICCVIPNWDLGKACNFIAGRSLSADTSLQSNTFVFFQTLDGLFNFFPLEGLIDDTKNKVFCDMQFDPLRRKADDVASYDSSNANRILSFEELSIVNAQDHVMNINRGMYASRTSVIDVSTREIEEVDYNYLDEFDNEGKHLRQSNQQSFPFVPRSSGVMDNPLGFWQPVIKSKGLFTDEEDAGTWYAKTYPKRTSKNIQLSNFALEGTLPGHLGLMAGHIVNVNIPYRPWPSGATGGQFIDPVVSGQYLVKSITRSFTLQKFEMRVLLVKDSVGLDMSGTNTAR